MADVTIKLDVSRLNQLLESIPRQGDKITKDAAYLIEQGAKMRIQQWPLIDTGALLNSIDVERVKPGHYLIGDFGGYTRHRKSKYGWRQISAGMEYGVYWELGHHNLFTRHYMRMPFLGPAAVDVTNRLAKMFADGLFT